jgi:hypothetical protein
MARVTIQSEYDKKQSTRAAVDKAGTDLDEWNARQPTLTKAVADARDADAAADGSLLKAASALKPGQIAHLKDGSELLVVDGQVSVKSPVDASEIGFDDGAGPEAVPSPSAGEGPETPSPEPAEPGGPSF